MLERITFSGSTPLVMTLTGDTFVAPQVSMDIDWSNSAEVGTLTFNCQEHDTYDLKGRITGADQFDITEEVHWTMTGGSADACTAAAGVPLPCEDKGFAHAKKQ